MAVEMKDTGNILVGVIPISWKSTRFRYVGKISKGQITLANNDFLGLPVIGASEMLGKAARTFTENIWSLRCEESDILILWDGANAGIVANGLRGIVSSTAARFRKNENFDLDSQYLFYNFKAAQPYFKSQSTGTTIPHMNSKYMDEYLVLLPPLSEQKAIANFLDEKCTEIDGLLADLDEQIKTLRAYEKSLIAETVTHGLNSNAPMKQSGIPWADTIPAHWEIEKGKYAMCLLQRPVKDDDGVITCFRDGQVTLRSNRREEGFTMSSKEYGYQGIEPGDLVVHGMDGFAGAIGVSDSRGKATPVLNVLDSKHNKRFLMYYLRNMAYGDVFLALSTGIRVRSCDLSWKKLGDLKLILPPKDEQDEIVNFIDNKISQIEELIADKLQQLAQLKEYKSSLIYEYVTGKKQVAI